MIAASTTLPVIGVPVPTRHLQGLDSLLSIVQMPGRGARGDRRHRAGEERGLLAIQILATADEALAERLAAFRTAEVDRVDAMDARVQDAARG
jgi:5-(carboxyamino)imidazole ribonucleotide mutase